MPNTITTTSFEASIVSRLTSTDISRSEYKMTKAVQIVAFETQLLISVKNHLLWWFVCVDRRPLLSQSLSGPSAANYSHILARRGKILLGRTPLPSFRIGYKRRIAYAPFQIQSEEMTLSGHWKRIRRERWNTQTLHTCTHRSAQNIFGVRQSHTHIHTCAHKL